MFCCSCEIEYLLYSTKRCSVPRGAQHSLSQHSAFPAIDPPYPTCFVVARVVGSSLSLCLSLSSAPGRRLVPVLAKQAAGLSMAKSIRSKVKKRNRTEMRKTVGDPHQRKLQARCTAKIQKSVAFSAGKLQQCVRWLACLSRPPAPPPLSCAASAGGGGEGAG